MASLENAKSAEFLHILLDACPGEAKPPIGSVEEEEALTLARYHNEQAWHTFYLANSANQRWYEYRQYRCFLGAGWEGCWRLSIYDRVRMDPDWDPPQPMRLVFWHVEAPTWDAAQDIALGMLTLWKAHCPDFPYQGLVRASDGRYMYLSDFEILFSQLGVPTRAMKRVKYWARSA